MACMCGDTQCPSCGAAQGTLQSDEDLICACGNLGELCIDPYAKEINDEEIEVILCSDCYQNRCDDI